MAHFSGSGAGKQKVRLTRAAHVSAILLGVGLVMSSVTARAADDDDESFEDRVIRNVMQGLGGTNMDNTGIEYRERSPLVIPPKNDLRPPDSNAEATVANWPKDPDVQRRKAAIAASKKASKDPVEAARALKPSEMNQRAAASTPGTSDSAQPGVAGSSPLSPSQLGFSGFGNIFGGNKAESAPFTGEPTRDSLTQPPAGYQTPSAAFAYGTGPRESLNKEYNPAAGKY